MLADELSAFRAPKLFAGARSSHLQSELLVVERALDDGVDV